MYGEFSVDEVNVCTELLVDEVDACTETYQLTRFKSVQKVVS